MEIRSVAFVGIGNMGSRMAACVLKDGFKLSVFDPNVQACATLEEQGAIVLEHVTQTLASDVIVLMVANDDQVQQVVHTLAQTAQNHDRQSTCYLCIMSTILPETVKKIEQLLSGSGIHLIEAPVSGGMIKAQLGTLTLMLGGEKADIEAVRPVMAAMGQHIFYCGALGTASVVKLINNMIGISNLYLVAEGFEMANKLGIDCTNLTNVLETSTGRNFLTEDCQVSAQQYAAWTQTETVFRSASEIVQKDLHIVQNLAHSVGLTLPTVASISAIVDATSEVDLHRWRAVAKYFSSATADQGSNLHE